MRQLECRIILGCIETSATSHLVTQRPIQNNRDPVDTFTVLQPGNSPPFMEYIIFSNLLCILLHVSAYIKHPQGALEYNTTAIQYIHFQVVQDLTR